MSATATGITITKISHSEHLTRIEYENVTNGEKHLVESKQKPTPEFETALQALVVDVVEFSEMSPVYAQLTVRGVSIGTIAKSDRRTLVITALYSLKYSPGAMCLNTACKHEAAEGAEPGKTQLPRGTVERLDALIVQAEKFLAGERAQVDLGFDGNGTPAKKGRGRKNAGDASLSLVGVQP